MSKIDSWMSKIDFPKSQLNFQWPKIESESSKNYSIHKSESQGPKIGFQNPKLTPRDQIDAKNRLLVQQSQLIEPNLNSLRLKIYA